MVGNPNGTGFRVRAACVSFSVPLSSHRQMALALGENTGTAVWLIVTAVMSTEPEGLRAQRGSPYLLALAAMKMGV